MNASVLRLFCFALDDSSNRSDKFWVADADGDEGSIWFGLLDHIYLMGTADV